MYVYLTGFTFYHTAKFLYSLQTVLVYCLQYTCNENVNIFVNTRYKGTSVAKTQSRISLA